MPDKDPQQKNMKNLKVDKGRQKVDKGRHVYFWLKARNPFIEAKVDTQR